MSCCTGDKTAASTAELPKGQAADIYINVDVAISPPALFLNLKLKTAAAPTTARVKT
jgi:hypothetical protein